MLSRSIVPRRRGPGKSCCAARARAVAVMCAVIGFGPGAASAAAQEPVVIPPDGTSYDQQAVAWWQYVVSIPDATNPLKDATGAHCADGQSGPVFFLVGNPFTGTADRTCTVHGAKSLFFPLVNVIDFHTTDDFNTPELLYRNEFVGFTRNGSGALDASGLHATVDGQRIPNLNPPSAFRACALPVPDCFPDAFTINLPPSNLFGLRPGRYFPALQDGYYLHLAALSPGTHTIKFGGNAFFGRPFSQRITYTLTVVP